MRVTYGQWVGVLHGPRPIRYCEQARRAWHIKKGRPVRGAPLLLRDYSMSSNIVTASSLSLARVTFNASRSALMRA